MDNVMYVAETLREKARFAMDNMDFAALGERIKYDEIVYLSILFIVSKMVMPRLSEPTRKRYLTPFLKLYNIGMVLFSFGCFVAMAKALTEIELYTNDCGLAFRHPVFKLTTKLFYYSKFVEYFDSWSLVLAGKPVSFLQSFHHFGAPWDLFLFYIAESEGVWIFVLFNSLVHTIMYAYYLAATFKIKVPGKILITLMQITQFNVGFYMVWWYKDIPCFAQSPEKVFAWVYNYFYVGVVLLLFINFTIWTYFCTSKKVTKAKQQ